MKTIICFLFTLQVFAQDLVDPAFQNFEHENPGCPINSECSADMGKLLVKWVKMLEKPHKDKVLQINTFRKQFGTPIQMLASKEIFKKAEPILWNSRCSLHNPKNPNKTIYRGYMFLKDKIQHEEAIFTTVYLYDGKEKTKYSIPYGDQVSLIKNDQLIVLKDFEDSFYKIAIAPDQSYRVVNIPIKAVNRALSRKVKEIECPEKLETDRKYFDKFYCQKVLDIDTNRLRTIQINWACT